MCKSCNDKLQQQRQSSEQDLEIQRLKQEVKQARDEREAKALETARMGQQLAWFKQQARYARDRLAQALENKAVVLRECGVCFTPFGAKNGETKMEMFKCGHWVCQTCASNPKLQACVTCSTPLQHPAASGIDFKFLSEDLGALFGDVQECHQDLDQLVREPAEVTKATNMELDSISSGSNHSQTKCRHLRFAATNHLTCAIAVTDDDDDPAPRQTDAAANHHGGGSSSNNNSNNNGSGGYQLQQPAPLFVPLPNPALAYMRPFPSNLPEQQQADGAKGAAEPQEVAKVLKAIRFYETVTQPGCEVVHATLQWNLLAPKIRGRHERDALAEQIAAAMLANHQWVIDVERKMSNTGRASGAYTMTLQKFPNGPVGGGQGNMKQVQNVSLDVIWTRSQNS
jgi:hypothetical protein